jgi:hypothetical protein
MAPRLIDYSDSLDVIWEEGVYTEARLTSDPHTQALAPRFAAFLTALDAVRTGQYGAWRAEVVAQAAVDTADDGLDDAVKGAGKALDAAVDENHDDPRWKRYVGKSTPKKIAAMGLDAELKVVQSWPESLKTEPEKALRAHAAPLAEAVAQGTAAVAQREQAQARRRDFMARDKAKLVDAFNDLRLDAHADLTKMVVPHKLDRAWPDRFFRKGSNAKADAPAAPTPVG